MKYKITYYRHITSEEYKLLQKAAIKIMQKTRRKYIYPSKDSKNIEIDFSGLKKIWICNRLIRSIKKDVPYKNLRWIKMEELLVDEVIKPRVDLKFGLDDENIDGHVLIHDIGFKEGYTIYNFQTNDECRNIHDTIYIKLRREWVTNIPARLIPYNHSIYNRLRYSALLLGASAGFTRNVDFIYDRYTENFWKYNSNGLIVFDKM
jgi:hypothetical protein